LEATPWATPDRLGGDLEQSRTLAALRVALSPKPLSGESCAPAATEPVREQA
jgi:hypothetical protein